MRVSSFKSFCQWHRKHFSVLVRLNYRGNTEVYCKVHVCLYVHRKIQDTKMYSYRCFYCFLFQSKHISSSVVKTVQLLFNNLFFSPLFWTRRVFWVFAKTSAALSNLSICIYRIAFVKIFPSLGCVLVKSHLLCCRWWVFYESRSFMVTDFHCFSEFGGTCFIRDHVNCVSYIFSLSVMRSLQLVVYYVYYHCSTREYLVFNY